ncbi:hypothetical protein SAY86_014046 [Trapa natans]|uniref:Uncharacterized protein n=1 Tax=Trapa natans TaxID=22666 RepID=A0AAN7KSE5_TRANT|nr:hypothetical protein SAY86_014046 [Trapa natans]
MAETSAAGAHSRNSTSSDAVLQDLVRRGWSFADLENIHATITAKSIIFNDIYDVHSIVDAVESELLNSDLGSIGAKSLPEPAILHIKRWNLNKKILRATKHANDFLDDTSLIISLESVDNYMIDILPLFSHQAHGMYPNRSLD